MKGIEKIYRKKRLIGIVFRNYFQIDGIKFFTDDSNSFQIGAHNRKKGIKLTPHVHQMYKALTINDIQEWLLVQEGKIRVTLYTKKGEIICKKTLKSGDSILLIEEGHGVDFLENSRIFEIKQGPFLESHHAKIFLR